MEFKQEEMQARIDEILDMSQKTIMKKLEPANALIREIKEQMSHGTDCILTAQLQEWAMVIPVLCADLVPYKEAYVLTKDLWDIETKQAAAKNLLDLDLKKTEIDAINKVAGTENSKKIAIAEYMRNILGGMQESLWCLGNAIRKILDGRIAIGDCK